MDKKLYEIYHCIYADCNDPYYGKEYKKTTIGIVYDTEDNVKKVILQLNEKNHSYGSYDPTYDSEYHDGDEDYFSYDEYKVAVTTIDDIKKDYRLN